MIGVLCCVCVDGSGALGTAGVEAGGFPGAPGEVGRGEVGRGGLVVRGAREVVASRPVAPVDADGAAIENRAASWALMEMSRSPLECRRVRTARYFCSRSFMIARSGDAMKIDE
jgi:hypothetical protein